MVAVVEITSQLKWIHFHKRPHKLVDLQAYDESSRGPWGATKFLAFKHKTALLASWAALLTIVATMVDPALQLVFSFPSRLANDPTAAPAFPVTYTYATPSSISTSDCEYCFELVFCSLQRLTLSQPMTTRSDGKHQYSQGE